MKLLKMSIADLTELREALDAIARAARQLEDRGLDPEISLTATATVLRVRSVIAPYLDAPEVLIEPAAAPAEAAPKLEAPAAVPTQTEAEAPPAATAPPPEFPGDLPAPTRTRPTRETARMVTTQSGRQVKKGPFDDEERARVREMLSAGRSVGEIATALNRRKQAVSTLMRNPAMKPGKPRAAQNAPGNAGLSGKVAATGDPARAATASPVTSPAPAPVNGSAWRPNGQATAPAELSGEARALWHELAGLRPDPAFDIEADYDLVDGLVHGRKLAEIALDLDVDPAAAKARFATLSEPILDARGRVRLDGQQALLKALAARVAAARAGAH